MVAGMVQQFREMQRILADRIDQYETAEFQALDGMISDTFEAIYNHTPKNAEEAQAMVDLFLDLIASNDAGDNARLIERVRVIIDSHAAGRGTPAPTDTAV